MAHPPSRQMSFRIGITIGDVDATAICWATASTSPPALRASPRSAVSASRRAVHEQVANKLSVQLADIGAQEVKNIPTPVHAYMVAMRREDGSYATPQVKKPPSKAASAPNWMWPLVVGVVSIVAIGVGGSLYFTKLETSNATSTAAATSNQPASPAPAPVSSPTPAASANAPAAPATATAAVAPVPAPSPPTSAKFPAGPFVGARATAIDGGKGTASNHRPPAHVSANYLSALLPTLSLVGRDDRHSERSRPRIQDCL